jgi:hypothetical protein
MDDTWKSGGDKDEKANELRDVITLARSRVAAELNGGGRLVAGV